jgi:hypothetical protein
MSGENRRTCVKKERREHKEVFKERVERTEGTV